MRNAGKIMLMVFFWRYEFQGLKTFDRTIGISFSINFQCFFPTKIRVRHGILYYAPGRKLCCETELGEVSRCESLVTLHHQSYLRTITSNFILQNISKPLLPRCTCVFCLYRFFYPCFFAVWLSWWRCQRVRKLWAESVGVLYIQPIVGKEYQAWD